MPCSRRRPSSGYGRSRPSKGSGAGFAVGARDLDLRGAGDLLGADQAGHVRLIGTGLYQRLLARALERARGQAPADGHPVELRLGIPVVIPDGYVPEQEVRIELYRRLSTVAGEAAVEEFALELADRFGPPPEPVRHLIGSRGCASAAARRSGAA